MRFNPDLASIYGYLCSDGYVIKNPITQKQKYYRIGLRNTNKLLLEDFQAKFLRVFGLNPHITEYERCSIGSKKVYYLLTKNQSFYSHYWSLPKLSKRNLSAWLRSYFDCDGWVEANARQNRRIGLDSVNKGGLFSIKEALKIFGIECRIRPHKSLYRLQIFGKENIIKFKKQIGFLHPNKAKRIEEAVNSYVNYYWDFPNDNFKLNSFLITLIKSKKQSDNRIRLTSIKLQNLKLLQNYLIKIFAITSSIYGPKRNNTGSIYYELCIQNKEDLKKIGNL